MKDFLVYAAGGITGLSWEEAVAWRRQMQDALSEYNIHIMNPLRGKDYLNNGKLLPHTQDEYVFSSAKAILYRDMFDVRRSDLVFVNFLGLSKVSIGTVMEVGGAWMANKPIVLAIDEKNVHQHPMIEQSAGWTVNNIEDGIYVVKSILLP